MKILLIEDELPAATRLKRMLAETDPAVEILQVCKSILSSVEWLTNNPAPELILMDIEIADGKSFEIFEQVKITSPVIFITAYDTFAIKAIKLNALDYLLKPINQNELKAALNRVKEHISNKTQSLISNAEVQRLITSLITEKKPKKLVVSTLEGAIFLEIEKILRLEADSNYTHIFLENGQQLMASKTLKEYEDILSDIGFYRVHNAHLVNVSFIKKYVKGDGGYIVMNDDKSIEVSRLRKKGLLDILFGS